MNIAFTTTGGADWIAGGLYLENLVRNLKLVNSHEVDVKVLSSGKMPVVVGNKGFFNSREIIEYQIPREWSAPWLINGVFKRFLLTDWLLARTLAENHVDVLLGKELLFRCQNTATLSWLPDFQHLRLAELFSETELVERDRIFRQSAVAATRVFLPSEDARKDFESFAPKAAFKARVFHPLCYVPASIYEASPDPALSRYHLPERFLYLPNQFWKHKNHEIVFQALRILKERGHTVNIVCTGYPGDYRDPAYFVGLWSKLSELGVRDQVTYLGMVPREDVFLLIRQCVCLINPSLFEGWGMTADEARSVGKRVLLSNIPAHREQDPPNALFFNPRDCDDLATKLCRIWTEGKPGPDLDLEAEARQRQPDRLRSHAEKLISLCQEAYDAGCK